MDLVEPGMDFTSKNIQGKKKGFGFWCIEKQVHSFLFEKRLAFFLDLSVRVVQCYVHVIHQLMGRDGVSL